MRVLTDGDRNMLSMACAAYAEYREADDFLREPGRGTTYETTTAGGETMFRPYPQVGQRNDAWRRYKSGLVEMGLTPAARTRVSQIGEGEDEQSEWDGL